MAVGVPVPFGLNPILGWPMRTSKLRRTSIDGLPRIPNHETIMDPVAGAPQDGVISPMLSNNLPALGFSVAKKDAVVSSMVPAV